MEMVFIRGLEPRALGIGSSNLPGDTRKNLSIILRCKSCALKLRPPKINWPNREDLLNMVQNSSYLAVSKILGVSDNAIRKHLKNV